jgi:choloylglycine hydrolase
LIFSSLLSIVVPHPTGACTAFMLRGEESVVMAKNYDWSLGTGLLLVNPSGVRKTALVGRGEKPAEWVSVYSSITFNQYGQEFPLGGMNRVGLAMEVLWLETTRYPVPNEDPSISALQWVQHCLDRFATVDEVAESARELGIRSRANLHFLTCDARGQCVAIEFLDGLPVIHSGPSLPIQVLTNSTYRSSLTDADNCRKSGDTPFAPTGRGCSTRFARTADAIGKYTDVSPDDPVTAAFDILVLTKQPGSMGTQWSIVYDLTKHEVFFTTRANKEVRSLRLEPVDIQCPTAARFHDLEADTSGDISDSLRDVDRSVNLDQVRASFRGTGFLTSTPEATLIQIAGYPEGMMCVHPSSTSELR